MPKREVTPEPADDSKYLIVNYPYPLHANMTIEQERYGFAHWIASCIGKESLLAIYHKPSAPNMVIIEVAKTCPQIKNLLGAHKWRNFLQNPEADEVDKESRVYFCHYKTGRNVQKNGWKRVDIWDSWFENFDPGRSAFVCNPYPASSFCEIPSKTQIGYALCRHLPSDVFSRPKPVAQHNIGSVRMLSVPGSEVYFAKKSLGSAAPIPSKLSKSSASVISSVFLSTIDTELPRTTSRASSESSSSATLHSTSTTGNVNQHPPFPPGLGPPPGLIEYKTSHSSFDWGWEAPPESVASHDSDGHNNIEIYTEGLVAAAIEDRQDLQGDDAQYWTEQPSRPTDWDKPICPVHKVACRPGICQIMSKIEHEKKRDAERRKKTENDGWMQKRTSGKGKGKASAYHKIKTCNLE
ncbi:hypothetical protein EW145_g4273 [Phellinidium pouzarii]|uniref:Uncharacterized protein n=1 Tax=Phellinidium pouzarii TaxID=167371 RepID=A0A4S4L444_9AGAM|nr:hypothetical protein EW145_g4273 [Phellinidium pouzarii]